MNVKACTERPTWAELRLGELLHIKHGYAFKGQFYRGVGI